VSLLTDGSSAFDPEIVIAAGEIAAFITTPELMSECARKTAEGPRFCYRWAGS